MTEPASFPAPNCKHRRLEPRVASIGTVPPNPAYSLRPAEARSRPIGRIAAAVCLIRRNVRFEPRRAALSRINTSSQHTRAHGIRFSCTAPWGCEGGKPERSRGEISARALPRIETPHRIRVVSTIPRSARGRRGRRRQPGRFYAAAVYGDGGLWSSYQADPPIFNGPDWSADVINPPHSSSTTSARANLQTSPG